MDAVCIALGEDIEQFHINAALDIVEAEIPKSEGETFETWTARAIQAIHSDVELFYVPHHKTWAQLELRRFYSFGFRVMNPKLVRGVKRNAKYAPRAELFDNPVSAYNRARQVAYQLRAGLKYECPPAEKGHRPTRTKWAKKFLKENAHTHQSNYWAAEAA
jgi:hypothetical protein